MFTVAYLVQITCIFKGKKNGIEAIFSCVFQLTWGTFRLRYTEVTVSGVFLLIFLIMLEMSNY